ncbi:hypothetical protein M0Q28_05525 [Patescibacteria group bacterium]|jgi:hypothetical protein|nr:hypothetical protein [Patescibacteria group bacterium]
MTLSAAQSKLLARINRCPKTGYYLSPKEDLSAQILFRAGLIEIHGVTAWPKKEAKG